VVKVFQVITLTKNAGFDEIKTIGVYFFILFSFLSLSSISFSYPAFFLELSFLFLFAVPETG
jgi:hypothetical protein